MKWILETFKHTSSDSSRYSVFLVVEETHLVILFPFIDPQCQSGWLRLCWTSPYLFEAPCMMEHSGEGERLHDRGYEVYDWSKNHAQSLPFILNQSRVESKR